MLLAEIQIDVQFGLLVISDSLSAEPIPSWASSEEQVTYTDTALVMRVRHPDDGGCIVRVWDDSTKVRGALVYSNTITVPSGVLRVSDALNNASAEVRLEPGRHAIEIFADSHVDATRVDIVVQ